MRVQRLLICGVTTLPLGLMTILSGCTSEQSSAAACLLTATCSHQSQVPTQTYPQPQPSPQPSTPPVERIASTASAKQVSNAVCDEVLSRTYQNTNVKLMLKTVSSARLKKDEYETTDAFNTRRDAAMEGIYNKLKEMGGSKYIIISKHLSPDWIKYNADSQTLDVGYEPDSITYGYVVKMLEPVNMGFWYIFTTNKVTLKKSSYIGSNAFGVRKDVEKEENDEYGVAFEGGAFNAPWPGKNYITQISMTPAEAKTNKGKINAIFVGSPIAPYASFSDDWKLPEVDYPFETKTHYKMLTASLQCAALVNEATGKVMAVIR